MQFKNDNSMIIRKYLIGVFWKSYKLGSFKDSNLVMNKLQHCKCSISSLFKNLGSGNIGSLQTS